MDQDDDKSPSPLVLSSNLLAEKLGLYDLASTQEIILRDEDVIGFEEECAEQLASIELLSLSHNKISSLDYFNLFTDLVELNLNFNCLQSLGGLQCTRLKKLFVSNNQITSLGPVAKLKALSVLSAYGNQLGNLDECVQTCRALPKLRHLDLGGNPCSTSSESYKFSIVRELPRVRSLDGETITQLDRDLADDASIDEIKLKDAKPVSRPSTASVKTDPWASNTTGFDPFSNPNMPRGDVRLFRDDFLNSNPILMEYLVNSVEESNESNDAEPSIEVDTVAAPSNFVQKLRAANTNDSQDEDDNLDESLGTVELNSEPPTSSRPGTASSGIRVQTLHLPIDPSDPHATIRKLIKHIETLTTELESTKEHTSASTAKLEKLEAENQRLQLENNNIPVLKAQVDDLKKQLATRDSNSILRNHSNGRLSRRSSVDTLDVEPQVTPKETKNSKEKKKSRRAPTENNGRTEARLSTSEFMDDSAMVDVELTELILQNEISLDLIRNEINNTKKEWQVQLEQAKAREMARVRPSTSLGLRSLPIRPTTSRPRTESSLSCMDDTRRMLHTSSGFRNGPEEALLKDSHVFSKDNNDPSSHSASDVNILTI